jgi:hypothetical protein
MPTSIELYHALAEQTGEYGPFETTALGTTTTLICSTLANTNLDATEFAGMAVLIEEGDAIGQVGHVKGGGLARTTGTITVADAFTHAIASSTTFSMCRLLPPKREGVIPGYLEIINQSVRRLPIRRTLSVSGVTNQHYYTIDTALYPSLNDPDRIRWIEYPVENVGDIPRRMRFEDWDWDANGETYRLYFRAAPFQTGQTFKIQWYAPGNSYIKKNGVWTNQTSQTAEMAFYTGGVPDEVLCDVDDVVTMGTALMFRALSRLNQPSAEVAEWLAKAQPSFRAAKLLQHAGVPEDRTTGVAKLRPVRVRYRGA